MKDDRLFILWDRKDGEYPPRDSQGNIASDGVLGRIGADNAYLTAYAHPNLSGLDVGCRVSSVHYSLSGTSGDYDIYRVR